MAAYLHLAGRGPARSVRTRRVPPGLVIDLGADGRAVAPLSTA
ncbi:MAG: hypothetical protein WD825_14555 [Gemmatimonadaceae bacterium]